MTAKYLCRSVLTTLLGLTLCAVPFATADAQSRSRSSRPEPESSLPSKGEVDGALVGAIAAVAVGVIVVVVLVTRKQTITGCVNPGANPLTITDEKDKRVYTMAGNTAGVTPGNRMKLQGKKVKPQGPDKTYLWESGKVSKDYGICHP
jgi:hypothetical protein